MSLSLCMIVKNEEKSLSTCLESIKDIVDEMIIVDTGSTDQTVEIAKSYGAKVCYFEWNDNFSDARNFSLEQANGDWILIMDGDDELKDSDKSEIGPLLKNSDVDIYLFQTLSYVGNNSDTVANLNVRLIKNNQGYKYKGAIHEQIYNSINDKIEKNKVRIEKIVVYHYGYLKSIEKEKDKSIRNMKILNKVLENDPHNNFHLYNMGNEYLRLGEFEKALEYYKRAYENFMPRLAQSPKLLLKMVMTLDGLSMYDEAIKVIDIGLEYYPKFTDLEYMRACVYDKQKKYSLAIKGFKKCMTMGDAPIDLCNINGVGGYKSSYRLGEIYLKLKDYSEAHHYYIETIKKNPSLYKPLYRICNILIETDKDLNKVKDSLERFFGEHLNVGAYTKIGDLFFWNEKYDLALEYFLKANKLMKTSSHLFYNIGMSHFFLKNYKEAYKNFKEIKHGDCYEQSVYKMILCEIFSDHMKNAEKLLSITKNFKDENMYIVYEAFKVLIKGKKCSPISESKAGSKQFVEPIFTLLNMIIKVSTPEIFEKSLQLLNLIDNDEVLLNLAKLYYNNGYRNLAYQEFIRSIKLFNKIDAEGLDMMRKALLKNM